MRVCVCMVTTLESLLIAAQSSRISCLHLVRAKLRSLQRLYGYTRSVSESVRHILQERDVRNAAAVANYADVAAFAARRLRVAE